jgi:hypothetical protein
MKNSFFNITKNLLVGLSLLFSSSVLADPVQWTENNHFYEVVFVDGGITWNDAKEAAELRGGYLVTITSIQENDFILNEIFDPDPTTWGTHHGPWLGGYQDVNSPSYSEPSGGWTWVTGEEWSFANWPSWEPNEIVPGENYLHIDGTGWGSWNDLTPDGNGNGRVPWYIVEYNSNPVPESTPEEQIGQILAFFNDGITNRTITVKVPQWLRDTGDAKRIRRSRQTHIELMTELLEKSQELINGGFNTAVCGVLEAAYVRIDGQKIAPADWFKGEDVPELADMINQLMTDLDCQ